jgi:hypothetical protein
LAQSQGESALVTRCRVTPQKKRGAPPLDNTLRSAAPARVIARAGAAGPRSRRCPRQHKTGRSPGPAGPSKRRCLRCRPRRCRPRQRGGRPTPCGGGTSSSRGKGSGTASRAMPHGHRVVPRRHAAPRRSCSHKGACSRDQNRWRGSRSESMFLTRSRVFHEPQPGAVPAARHHGSDPSQRGRTARSSSRVSTTGRLAGFLARSILSRQPNRFLTICR